MLQSLASDTIHYGQLSKLFWKYGRGELARQLGLGEPEGAISSQESNASECAKDIEALGVAYIKLAQIASTRQDALPAEYIEAFSRLQDDVEPVAIDEIESSINDAFGASSSSLFKTFDSEPLATASVGQVHRATLFDGRDVVVKVRRPHVAEEATDQIRSLKRLAATLDDKTEIGRQFRFRSLVGAVEYALSLELDYRKEANHLQQLTENLQNFPLIRIPQPIPQMVSSEVLVMEYLSGPSLKDVSGVVLNGLDTDRMAQTIVQAYLQQILLDGLFHADPHPGNLKLHDGGKVGLLDGGMVVSLPPGLRRAVGAMLLAFCEGEGEKATSIAARIARTGDAFDSNAYRAAASRVIAEAGDGMYEAMSLGRTMIEFLNVSGKHDVVLPFEIILLSKAFLQLETTLQRLSPKLDANALIREYAIEVLADRAKEQLSIGQIASTALDTAELASTLPERVNEITRLLAENQVRLSVDAIDEHELLGGLRKIANRITSGLVVAAMIVGASLIMQVETDWTLFGYPALAIVFFLLSATIGFVLIYKAVIADDH